MRIADFEFEEKEQVGSETFLSPFPRFPFSRIRVHPRSSAARALNPKSAILFLFNNRRHKPDRNLVPPVVQTAIVLIKSRDDLSCDREFFQV